jgi:hypothetical protein
VLNRAVEAVSHDVLSSESSVEDAALPYSIQTDPSPIVTESEFVPATGPPVAKIELAAVGAASAAPLIATESAAADGIAMLRFMRVPPSVGQ